MYQAIPLILLLIASLVPPTIDATAAEDQPRCSVGVQQHGMKPKGQVKDLPIIGHFSKFGSNASACARLCCERPSCTMIWMIHSICVLLNCSGDAKKDVCLTVPEMRRPSLVVETRNQVDVSSDVIGFGNTDKSLHTQKGVASRSCSTTTNVGCGVNQECKPMFPGSTYTHCVCAERYTAFGDDCVPLENTATIKESSFSSPTSTSSVVSTTTVSVSTTMAMEKAVEKRKCVALYTTGASRRRHQCGQHAYCHSLQRGGGIGECHCFRGFVLDGDRNCVRVETRLEMTKRPTKSPTASSGKTVMGETVALVEGQQACDPVSNRGCGEHEVCTPVVLGSRSTHCVCELGYKAVASKCELDESSLLARTNRPTHESLAPTTPMLAKGQHVQRLCIPSSFLDERDPKDCGLHAVCSFISEGKGRCVCVRGYAFSSQGLCIPQYVLSHLPPAHNRVTSQVPTTSVIKSHTLSLLDGVGATRSPSSQLSVHTTGQLRDNTAGLSGLEGQLNDLDHRTRQPTMAATTTGMVTTPSVPLSPTNGRTTQASAVSSVTTTETSTTEMLTTEMSTIETSTTETSTTEVLTTEMSTTETSTTGTSTIETSTTKNILTTGALATTEGKQMTEKNTPTTKVFPTLTTEPARQKKIVVSAGNRDLILPENKVTLIAITWPPAPKSDSSYFSFEWEQTSGPSFGSIANGHSSRISLSQLKEGHYGFKVTVVGKKNEFGMGFVNVTVHPPKRVNTPPHAVITAKNGRLEVTLPRDTVILDAKQSTDDVKGLKFHWEQVKGPLKDVVDHAEDQDGSPILIATDLIAGSYKFKVTVTDSDGATDVAYANVTVHPEVDYPPHAITGDSKVIKLPIDSVILYGNASRDDKGIVKYLWDKDAHSPKEGDMTGTTSPILHLRHLAEGHYTFVLTVTDTIGQTDSSEVSVVVEPVNNIPPHVDAGPDKELIWPDNAVQLSGEHTSDDMGVSSLRFHWDVVKVPPRSSKRLRMNGENQSVIQLSDLSMGKYTFKLTVVDKQDASASDTVDVTVNPDGNKKPTAIVGPDVHIHLPTRTAELDGSKSYDDDRIVSYQWLRSAESPAIGDVENGTDHQPVLKLANLIPGTYTFYLTVTDAKNLKASATAHVFIKQDSHAMDLVDMHVKEDADQFSQKKLKRTIRYIALQLQVDDDSVVVERVTGERDNVHVLFYVLANKQGDVKNGRDVAEKLSQSLSATSNIDINIVDIQTYVCQDPCSGHGHCDPDTKHCVCDGYWMENPFKARFGDKKINCDWSIVYVVLVGIVLGLVVIAVLATCICVIKRRRVKAKRRRRYALLNDAEEESAFTMSMMPKGKNQKSSLMVSESGTNEDDVLFDSATKPLTFKGSNGMVKNNRAKSLSKKT